MFKRILTYISFATALLIIHFGIIEKHINYIVLTILFILLLVVLVLVLLDTIKDKEVDSAKNDVWFVLKALLFYFAAYNLLQIGAGDGHPMGLWIIKGILALLLISFPIVIWIKNLSNLRNMEN